ncbi:hypothetical protein FHL15_004425 [Xylaria flabelliformis]|uniref:Lysine-specific metallo-endopeptidase domain-containing protein n=1 Tax=Xylaria flabelliformis TaxID=2512241 RepID=A0A553I376_9PEZI|nr:hypothetical protein FHL15_004425 [Xylaria flabelliformis]
MKKFPTSLSLATAFLTLLSCTVAVNVDELFDVQGGKTDGGCDEFYKRKTQSGDLDNWVTEISYSVDASVTTIENYGQDPRVRRAMRAFFGIQNTGRYIPGTPTANAVDAVRLNIQRVQEFFNRQLHNDGTPYYPLGDRFLFCGSDFLVYQPDDTQALDFQAQDIFDGQGNLVRIADVPSYAEKLNEDADNDAWWSGFLTDTNGYYFSPTGGEYCDGTNLGLTATIQQLVPGPNGGAQNGHTLSSIVLCPYSFTESPQPNTYKDANALLTQRTDLAKAVPKSSTLLHEAFHLLFGAGTTGFLEDADEVYDIAACVTLARAQGERARRNPENYVFFIAHMYHMLGTDEGNVPESIRKNWDFAADGSGQGWVYGATETDQAM